MYHEVLMKTCGGRFLLRRRAEACGSTFLFRWKRATIVWFICIIAVEEKHVPFDLLLVNLVFSFVCPSLCFIFCLLVSQSTINKKKKNRIKHSFDFLVM